MAVRKRVRGLEVAHPNAAGIDIGSASHFVAVPPDCDDEPVRVREKTIRSPWWELPMFPPEAALVARSRRYSLLVLKSHVPAITEPTSVVARHRVCVNNVVHYVDHPRSPRRDRVERSPCAAAHGHAVE